MSRFVQTHSIIGTWELHKGKVQENLLLQLLALPQVALSQNGFERKLPRYHCREVEMNWGKNFWTIFTAALLSLSSPTNTTLLQRHHLSPAQGRFKFREINCNKCFMNKDFFFLVYLSSYMLSSSPDPWSLGSASSHQPTTSAPLKIFTLCSLSTDFSGLHISPLKPKLYSHIKQNPNLSQVSHVITFSHCPCPFLLPFPLLTPPASPQIENILPLLLRATGVPNRLLFRYTAFDRLKFRFSLDLEVRKLISFSHPTDIWIPHYKPPSQNRVPLFYRSELKIGFCWSWKRVSEVHFGNLYASVTIQTRNQVLPKIHCNGSSSQKGKQHECWLKWTYSIL